MFYENKPDSFMLYDDREPKQFPLHIHQYIEIVHLVEGHLEMQIGAQKYTLHSGDISVSFPNVAHDYHTLSAPGETRFIIINCSPDFLPLHKMYLLEKQPATPVISADKVHEDILYAEKRLFDLKPYADRTSNNVLLSSFCSIILSHLFPLLHLEDIQTQPQDLTNAVIAYVAKHYLEDISLSSIASHFGIGKYTLSRIFSSVLDCNFISYINSLRISYSRTLLVNTDMNITRIAIESGFNNQQTFNRIFKSIEGCTPKEYRQTHTSILIEPDFI